jgi:hypothetical protein
MANINSSFDISYMNSKSFDSRQMINNKPIGVLKYNNDIRKKLLERNIGKYFSITSDNGIGYISNFYSNESSKPFYFDEEGLLEYTHIYDSKYQKNINKKYGLGEYVQYYRNESLTDSSNKKWNGSYNDYTDYINEVLGFPNTSINLLSNLFKENKLKDVFSSNESFDFLTVRAILLDILKYDDLKYAMEKTRIGTVSPNPLGSLAGAVVTNISNFSGKDTPLGTITNYLYAHTLKNGAQFNSLRKTKYITPEVYNKIGNKLSTIGSLDSDFRIDDETGRMTYELGNGISTISYEDITIDDYDLSIKTYSDRYRYDNLYRNYVRRNNDGTYVSGSVRGFLPFMEVYGGYKGYYYSKNDNFVKTKILETRLVPTIKGKIFHSWNEGDTQQSNGDFYAYYNENGYHGGIKISEDEFLLKKTNDLFNSHNENGIDTLIGRYVTSGGRDKSHNEVNLLQSAVSSFGMSHGRNLLNKKAYKNGIAEKDKNGYDNPYCRVWTYHNQYSKISDLIRPFSETSNGKTSIKPVDKLQSNWWMYGRRKGSADRLNSYSVINRNGFVNITPTSDSENDTYVSNIKQCMFSIENLAWKDVIFGANKKIINNEQIGPNGGRIMWFPPYDLKFNENVTANWLPNDFIGRGEKIYTYTNTERSGTLSFVLLVDHPSIVDMWKNNKKSTDEHDDEQTLLRFFAGCEQLELDNKPLQPKNEKQQEDNPIEPEPIIENDTNPNDIVFYIFFPNYYSGMKDNFNDALEYLNIYETSSWSSYDYTDKNSKFKYKVDSDFNGKRLAYDSNYKDDKSLNLNESLDAVKKVYSDATTTFNKIIETVGDNFITSAIVESYASSHGDSADNVELYNRRGDFAKKFIEEKLGCYKVDIKKRDEIEVNNTDKENISGDSAKYARCAKVVLKTLNLQTFCQLDALRDGYTDNFGVNDSGLTSLNTNNSNIESSRKEKRRLKREERKNKRKNEKEFNDWANDTDRINDSVKESLKSINIDDINVNVISDEELTEQINRSLPISKVFNGSESIYKDNIEEERWESEAEYFHLLGENDSFLYSRLIDKIKYFSPAFHSITPEGFNSRLSFLHQCTRQGCTIGVSDYKGDKANDGNYHKSAGNLSFGTPPICVLRIGDFYNTKIIIDSMTIDYENQQWDINTEGIGMQPMFARISLNFKFLGGSDLSAPISRLQNAVSFNYYANQSIYDDRADIGMYENNTAKIQGKPWKPIKEN